MKVLELFAGSRSIGKAADRLAFDVYSSDIEQFGGIDYVTDILEFDVTKIPFVPDIIWASCPCTAFSVAAIGKNWTKVGDDYIPKNPRAEFGLKLVQKTLEIINHFNPTYFFIENPRGMLRKMPIMADLPRQGVTYCQYGDTRMKPTDIWTNSTNWIPRPMCKNGDPCHVAAPRGSKTGTQGLKGAYERSKIPEDLCFEILKSCI
jgi:site-specific DNA-cytosine methylase